MNTQRIRDHLRRNGWLLTALVICVAGCLLAGGLPGGSDPQNEQLSRVLSAMAGAGEVEVAIHYDAQSVPCGAVVLARGASSIAVRLQLSDAVSTLLGLDPSAVAVYPLEGGAP